MIDFLVTCILADMQLVQCEEKKKNLVRLLDELEAREHVDSTVCAPANNHTHGRDLRYCRYNESITIFQIFLNMSALCLGWHEYVGTSGGG